MKKFLIIIIVLILFCSVVFAKENKYSVGYAIEQQNNLTVLRRNIALLHNVLNLNDFQIEQTMLIMIEYDKQYDKITDLIMDECKTLEILKKNKAPLLEINLHKNQIKNLQNQIKTLTNNEHNKFLKILDKKQRKKYKLVKHLQNRDYKRDLHCRKYMQTPLSF